jgi:TPR repeat protein
MLRPTATACLASLIFIGTIVKPVAAAATWTEVKSPHFTVVSDAGEKRARFVAAQFELIRDALMRVWPGASTDFGVDVVVYAARDEKSMRELVPESFKGRGAIRPSSVFSSSPFAHFVAMRADLNPESQGQVNPYITSYWSYVALVVRATFGRDLPLWFERGLADVFSNTVVRDNAILVGQVIPWRLQRLRSGGRPQLDVVLTVDRQSPYMTNGDMMELFDSTSWALVHYLMFGNKGNNLQVFNRLTQAIKAGSNPNDALAQLYGGLDAVRSGHSNYISQELYLYQKYPIGAAVDVNTFAARTLSASDAALALARIHVALRQPALARQHIAAASGAPAASELEGILIEAEDGPDDKAREAYKRASEAGAASFYGEYRFASLSWPDDEDADVRERLIAIEASLKRATAANPRFVAAHQMHAQALERLGRADEALPVAQRAVVLAPLDPYSHLALARVYWAQSKRDDAVASAKRALAAASTESSKENAQQLLRFFARAKPVPAVARASNDAAGTSGATQPPQDNPAVLGPLCEKGDDAACGRLAAIAEQACGNADMRACATAAFLFHQGRGVQKDAAKGLKLLEKSCDLGFLEGCTQVAVTLAARQTADDLERARSLLDVACQGGHARACELRKSLK